MRQALRRAHITGPHRTLTQDVVVRHRPAGGDRDGALSTAVNDTFTALTCIDWLGESLCRIAAHWDPARCAGTPRGWSG